MSAPEEDADPGVPEWVVTYGDMMSLLLTFFIMLVSLSEMKSDDGTMRAMLNAVREAFGPTDGASGVPGTSTQTSSALGKLSSRGSRSEGGTKKASRNSAGNGGAHKSVQRINHGTVVTLGGPTQFAPFDATLTDEIKGNLSVVAEVIANAPQRVVIRGHASPQPPPPDAPFLDTMNRAVGRKAADVEYDQFDLSFARAHAVAQYLIELGLDPNRLIISAAGDAEPRLATQSSKHQTVNRRVDVFLIDSYITRPKSADAGRR
jgi:chemotaxis protein MotB